jgi:hypothetical protein
VVGSDARGGQGVMALSPPALCALRGEFPLWPSSTQTDKADGDDPKLRDGDTSYLRVNVWRGRAEHLADSLVKGDRVMVHRPAPPAQLETPEGDKRSVTD